MTNVSCGLGLDGVFTLRIVGAAIKDTEASTSFLHLAIITHRTFHTGSWVERWVVLDVFTLRVVGTGDEATIATIAFDEHTIFAVRTMFPGFFGPLKFLAVDGPGTIAIWEVRAGEEFAVFGKFYNHGTLAFWTEDSFGGIPKVGHFF